jgi:hypothetical protein
VSRERLSPRQWARLEAELRRGPLAHGFAQDQRWTLGRIKTLIGKLFHLGYTVEGFEDEAGQGLKPPKGRTWARRGARPVVRVRGGGGGRVSIAGVACYRPGDRRTCSTSCACTAAARARPRGSPGRTTGT